MADVEGDLGEVADAAQAATDPVDEAPALEETPGDESGEAGGDNAGELVDAAENADEIVEAAVHDSAELASAEDLGVENAAPDVDAAPIESPEDQIRDNEGMIAEAEGEESQAVNGPPPDIERMPMPPGNDGSGLTAVKKPATRTGLARLFTGYEADRVRHYYSTMDVEDSPRSAGGEGSCRLDNVQGNRLRKSTARLVKARARCLQARGETAELQPSETPLPTWLIGSPSAERHSAKTLRTAFISAFLHFDKDQDGYLDVAELEALGEELGISGLLEPQVLSLMELLTGTPQAKSVDQSTLLSWWAEAHDTLLTGEGGRALRDSAASWQLGARSTPAEVAAGIAARLGVLCERFMQTAQASVDLAIGAYTRRADPPSGPVWADIDVDVGGEAAAAAADLMPIHLRIRTETVDPVSERRATLDLGSTVVPASTTIVEIGLETQGAAKAEALLKALTHFGGSVPGWRLLYRIDSLSDEDRPVLLVRLEADTTIAPPRWVTAHADIQVECRTFADIADEVQQLLQEAEEVAVPDRLRLPLIDLFAPGRLKGQVQYGRPPGPPGNPVNPRASSSESHGESVWAEASRSTRSAGDLATSTQLDCSEMHVCEHQDYVLSCAFNALGTRLAAGGEDQFVSVWNIEKWSLDQATHVRSSVLCVAWAADTVVAGLRDGRIVQVSLDNIVMMELNIGSAVVSLAVHPTAGFIVSGTADGRAVYTSATGEMLTTDWVGREEVRVACSPDGNFVATLAGTMASLHAVEDANLSQNTSAEIVLESVNCLAFTPDGTRLAVGGSASMTEAAIWILSVWRQLEVVETLIMYGCADGLLSLAWSAEGLLAACGCDSRVTVWNKSGVEVFSTEPQADWLSCVTFGPQGRMATCGYDDRVSVYSLFAHKEPKPAEAISTPVPIPESESERTTLQGLGVQVRRARAQISGSFRTVGDAIGALGLDARFRELLTKRAIAGADLFTSALRHCFTLNVPSAGRTLRNVLAPGGSLAVLHALRTSVHGIKSVQVQQVSSGANTVTATFEFPQRQRSFAHFLAMLLSATDVDTDI